MTMDKANPSITILTPCYNYSKYFNTYMKGLLNQTRKPQYVIIVDDCSPDGSFEIIKQKLVEDYNARIQLMEIHSDDIENYECYHLDDMLFAIIKAKQNGGPSKARNLGIKVSLNFTDIYAMYDMDDEYYPDKIAKSLIPMELYPHVGLVYSDYFILNTKTGVKIYEFKESFNYKRLTEECIVSNNSLVRAAALQKVGIYDELLRVAEDYDLWLRITEYFMAYHLPEALYEYRVTGEGASFAVKQEIWQQCWQRVKQKCLDRQGAER